MTTFTVKQRGHECSVLIKHGRDTVAEVFTTIEPGDQYETAALLAAAPDLLAAAIDALETFERRFPDSPTAHDLRAAIAKATGA